MKIAEKHHSQLLCCMLPWLVCVTSGLAAEQRLFDFGHSTDLSRIEKSDAAVTAVKAGTGMAMRMITGTSQSWPGVTLPALDGHWDLSPFAQVVVGVKNAGSTRGVHDKFIPLSRVGGMACEPECVEAASSVETTHSHDGVGTFLGPEHARLLAAAADHAAAAGFNDP